ncbi:DNA damage response protein [Escovopsis weberi]|uniref:DNA damage response protein n=1 Tax=Escovopsis weberi TaxID=150374 RepID=A0A0M9VVD1_ESCWE|nr:DNA damage response protein [Escovopsis weberi]
MPIGLQRFNTKKSQPNPSIVFIKALKGPDEAVAQAFLERIAAQCVPIMREHSLSVMTVEEFPANREFVGRNFNGGEVIQLVLKAQSGRWLPFRYVQMVMMHELAHCTQMNHSRAFWAVRNGYAAQMQALWARGYTGEGLWGRGATLGTGEWERDAVREGDALPEHLCGGTYRSRRGGGKRKRAVAPTYKERKERRIMKRFGAGGVALGADEGVKESLEGGKGKGKGKGKAKGRPRVAGSVRGRELRAAAALARFEQSKGDGSAVKKKKGDDDDDDDDDDDERAEGGEDVDEITSGSDYEGDEEEGELVMDVDGKRLVDGSGRGLG